MGLHGKKDKGAPSHLAEAMQSGIKDWRMRTFPGGHVCFLLRQKPCLEALVDFLASSTFHVREQHLRSPTLLCRENHQRNRSYTRVTFYRYAERDSIILAMSKIPLMEWLMAALVTVGEPPSEHTLSVFFSLKLARTWGSQQYRVTRELIALE
jgi:hypothetical protein